MSFLFVPVHKDIIAKEIKTLDNSRENLQLCKYERNSFGNV